MKKLMIAAAAAAMVSGAFAGAQVYEIRAVMVTTEPAIGNFIAGYNPFVTRDTQNLVFRKVATKSYGGLAWGCDCNSIGGAWNTRISRDGTMTNYFGSCIWDANANPVWVAKKGEDLGIQFINAIENYGNVCEMTWKFQPLGYKCSDDKKIVPSDKKGELVGAGFGTLANLPDLDGSGCPDSYVASANGLFAGYLVPTPYSYDLKNGKCLFCGDIDNIADCAPSVVWNFCECDDFTDDKKTAAYGQWVIAYNAVYSQRLGDATNILDIDYFTPTMVAAIRAVQVGANDE